MRSLVPPHIQRMASSATRHETATGASLIIDAEGSTALSARLEPHGTEGAEALADILAAIFAPMVEHVTAYGGRVGEIAGDGILGLFPGDPDEAVLRAIGAAGDVVDELSELSDLDTPDGPASLTVRSVVGAGRIDTHIWLSPDPEAPQNAAYITLGSAVDEARRGEAITPGGVVSVGPNAARHIPPNVHATPLSDAFVSVGAVDGLEPLPDRDPWEPSEAIGHNVRFFPRTVVEADLRGEFRDVVAVFVEVGGGAATRYEAEMETVLAALIRHRGYLSHIVKPDPAGEGIRLCALWGAPTSREHDIGYALRFLDEVRANVAGGVKAGVTRSTSFTGFIGSPLQQLYTAIGPGINLSARMCNLADWNEIRADQNITSRLREPWSFEQVGELGYRGFSHPVATYRITHIPPYLVTNSATGDLLGRDGELDRLEDLLAPLWAGRNSGIVAVTGDPGMGKSRLTRALESRLSQRDPAPVWIHVQADEIRTQPLATMRDALFAYFGSPGREESGNRLDHYLGRLSTGSPDLSDELTRTRAALGDLLQLAPDVDNAAQLDPKTRFENLVLGIENLVEALERTAPVIILVADGHWLDGGTAEVLRRVSVDLETLRVAIVIETRTPEIGLLADHQIDLGPLEDVHIAELFELAVGEEPSNELITAIATRSGGNPFFARQLIDLLNREGFEGFNTELLESLGVEGDVPLDMRRVLVARLDDLPMGVRRVVQTGSVLGRDIELAVLRKMHAEDHAFDDHVQGAIDEGIWDRVDTSRVAFSDLLVRDAAYGMQLHSDVRVLHAAAASALEHSAGTKGGRAAELGYHHDRAGNGFIASGYYLEAGRTATERYDNHEALTHLDRALELIPADDVSRRYETLRLKYDVYELEGNRDAQEETIGSIERLSGISRTVLADVLMLRARLLVALGRYQDAEDHLANFKPSSELAPGQWGSLTFLQATIARNQGRTHDARELAQSARESFEEAGDALKVASIDDFIGGVAWETGDFETAVDLHRAAATTFGAAGQVVDEVRALNNLGTAIFALGDYSAARAIHQDGADRSHTVGYRMGEGDHLDNIGGTAWAVGDLDSAIDHYTRALTIREAMNDAWGVAISKGNLGATMRAMGNPEGGLASYREALEIDRRIGRRRGEAYDLHGIGLCHLDLSRYNLATESLGRSAAIRVELGEQHLANESNVACAVAMLRRGDTAAARELVEQVLANEREDFFAGAVESTATRLRCIEVLDATAPKQAEILRLRARQDVLERANRISDPEDRQSYLERVEAHSRIIADK